MIGLMPLEILHLALVLLGGRARFERAEIAALARLRVDFAGVEPIFAGLQFAYHEIALVLRSTDGKHDGRVLGPKTAARSVLANY
jgi:hypothetical protein